MNLHFSIFFCTRAVSAFDSKQSPSVQIPSTSAAATVMNAKREGLAGHSCCEFKISATGLK
jgi:hypothetical protein